VRSVQRIIRRLVGFLPTRLHGRGALRALICLGMVIASCLPAAADAPTPMNARELIERMETAYKEVSDYQTRLVITGFGKDSSFTSLQKLLYTFKKPDKIRLDFETPHRGMTVIYPDREGRVWIRPGFWFPLFDLRLEPTNANLEVSPGQQIHQTDLGMLIRNITHSVTDCYLGDLEVSEDRDRAAIRVLADNPFRRGRATRYVFHIDKTLWLPVAVEESSAAGVLQRTVVYQHLRLNTGVLNSFFQID
jgi:outer membrane lipoprotein-sorting protein